jgi:hypothetical protein
MKFEVGLWQEMEVMVRSVSMRRKWRGEYIIDLAHVKTCPLTLL